MPATAGRSRGLPHERMLSITDVSDLLHISKNTVRSLVRTGQLQPVRVGKRLIRFRPDAVIDLLKPHSEQREEV